MKEYLKLKIKNGVVTIKLLPDVAPLHVEQISRLANNGFYNGLKWHRVIDGFMAQTGCPVGNGSGDCGEMLKAEFNKIYAFKRGAVGAARTQDPNTASSQFFICFKDSYHLNGNYTLFGVVENGMEHVDALQKGDPNKNGFVENPDIIEKAWVEKVNDSVVL